MSSWSAGYNVDVDYTYGYYAPLNPARTTIPFLLSGIAPPNFANCCELGFGQGISLNIHNASTTQNWWGTDFMPNQVAFAEFLNNSCDKRPTLSDDSFAEYIDRTDLPKFDYIGLHGIWSWISDANRGNIAKFIERHLNVGGVVYMSYNSLPGWSDFVSVRDILIEHADRMSPDALGIVDKISSAKTFLKNLIDTDPKFLAAIPSIKGRLDKLENSPGNYLVHEFFNSDWCPMHFSDVCGQLERSKLDWACSADYKSYFDFINLSSDQTKLLAEISDRSFKETVRDYITNQQFRMDYWVRGAVRISEIEKVERFGQLRVMPIRDLAERTVEISGVHAKYELNNEKYGCLYKLLKPLEIQKVADLVASTRGDLTTSEVATAISILSELQLIHVVSESHEDSSVVENSRALNRNIVSLNKPGERVSVFACPVNGGGIGVSRFDQLFLEATWNGVSGGKKLADYALDVLAANNQSVIREGKALPKEDALSLVKEKSELFLKTNKTIYQALGIA